MTRPRCRRHVLRTTLGLILLAAAVVLPGCYATVPLEENGRSLTVGGEHFFDDVLGRKPAEY